jgi:GTP-binding protein
MPKEHYANDIKFLLSAARLEQLPADVGREVAFIGGSNVGKSSAINVIAGVKGLARAGKTPGVTRLINVFTIDANRRLIDLPGYGYAKAAKHERIGWEEAVNDYLLNRRNLAGLFLLMDIRHPFKEQDLVLLDFARQNNLPLVVLLNKADKLTRAEQQKALRVASNKYPLKHGQGGYIIFSATARIGLEEVFKKLDLFFGCAS